MCAEKYWNTEDHRKQLFATVQAIRDLQEFLVSHKDDIENSINDYGDLKTVYNKFCGSSDGSFFVLNADKKIKQELLNG